MNSRSIMKMIIVYLVADGDQTCGVYVQLYLCYTVNLCPKLDHNLPTLL